MKEAGKRTLIAVVWILGTLVAMSIAIGVVNKLTAPEEKASPQEMKQAFVKACVDEANRYSDSDSTSYCQCSYDEAEKKAGGHLKVVSYVHSLSESEMQELVAPCYKLLY